MKQQQQRQSIRVNIDRALDAFRTSVDRISIREGLDEKHRAVLQLVACGRTNSEIAAELGISRAAVLRRVVNRITWSAVLLDDEQVDRRTLTAVHWCSQRPHGKESAPDMVGLSERGQLLFPLVAIGWSNQRIAAFLCGCGLCLGEETIDSHVDSIRVWVEIRTGRPASRARAIAYFWGGQWEPSLNRAA